MMTEWLEGFVLRDLLEQFRCCRRNNVNAEVQSRVD